MADTKLRREDEIDKRANDMFSSHPDLQESEQAAGRDPYAIGGADQAEAYANDPSNATKNISDAQEGEDSAGDSGFFRQSSAKKSFSAKGIAKKGGPTGGIIGLIFGSIFGMGVLLSPSLAIVHLKEVLTDDLNDTVAAMDVRSTHVFKTKLKDLGKRGPSSCALVKVRCGLRGMSDKQIKNFEKAGIKVETVGEKNGFGKTQIKSLTFESSAGRDVKIENPSQLNKFLGDSNIRNQLRRAYNPKFYSVADKLALKTFREKLKTDNSRKLTSNDPEKLAQEIDDATAGEKVELNTDKKPNNSDDSEEVKKEKDTKATAEADEFKKGIDGAVDTDSTFKNVSKGMTSGVMKGVMVTGGLDTACSVYGGIGAISALAKTKRALQLAQYAMIFFNFADSIKAGDATPEQADYVGVILTSIDIRKTIQNESSKLSSSGLSEVTNPDYNKSAFDAQAIKAGFYNDAPVLNSRSQNYLVGGGMVGSLDGIRNKITDVLGAKNPRDIKSKCDKIQNIFVRIGSAAIGIGLGAASFGTSTAISMVASTAIGMAMPLIQSYIGKIIAGKVVSSDTKGVDAGNAIFSGAGVLLGSSAQARGMKPASKSDLKSYMALKNDINNEYTAMETEDDSKDPFNVNKRYSFIGSFARSILPATMHGGSFFSFTNTLSLLRLSASGLTTSAYAVGTYNPERFSKCSDTAYQGLNIDADIMCNVRYTLSQKELSMDTDDVIREMYNIGQINEDGEAQDKYAEWLKNCTERTDGWGETSESDGSGSDGNECLKNDHQSSLFRVYTMDNSITDGMDNGVDAEKTGSSEGTSIIGVASYNFCQETNNKCPVEKVAKKAPIIASVIKGSLGQPLDIIAAQEVSKNTLGAVLSATGYSSYPTPNGEPPSGLSPDKGRAILWNTSKFTQISSGRLPDNYDMVGNDGTPAKEKYAFPWVQLKPTNGGEKNIFVLSIHSPRGKYAGPEARINNAKKAREWAKSVSGPNSIVIIAGDFNRSGNQEYTGSTDDGTAGPKYKGGAYCELTGEILIHASDLSRNISATEKCPTSKASLIPFDQIYVSSDKNIKASNWGHIADKSGKKSGTDHSPAYVTLEVPGIGGSEGSSSSPYTNPVIKENFPDPSFIRVNDTNYIYESSIRYKTSKDAVNWSKLTRPIIKGYKLESCLWAPDISKIADKFVLSWSGGNCNANSFRIQYAIGDSPAGPFTYKGSLTKSSQGIDPQIYDDNGTYYLIYTMGGGGIRGFKLKYTNGTLTRDGEEKTLIPKTSNDSWTIEAPFVVNKDGKYYLYFSAGNWTNKNDYMLKVASSSSVLGSYTRGPGPNGGTILKGNQAFTGPGTSTVFSDSQGKSWVMYHARPTGKQGTPNKPNERMGMLDPIDYVNGWPRINDGTPSYTQRQGPSFGGSSGGSNEALNLPSKDGWVWPVPGVKSLGVLGYGKSGSKGVHKGIDIGQSGGLSLGKTVVAAHSGTVSRVWGENDACGAYISIKATGTNYYAAYQHLNGNSIKVKANDPVVAGQPIAEIGRQGGSTCGSSGFYHLHFSIESKAGTVSAYANSFPNGTIDPLKVLPQP